MTYRITPSSMTASDLQDYLIRKISVVKPTAIAYVLLAASNVIVPAAVVAAAAAVVDSSLVELVKADPVIVDNENSKIIDFNLQCHWCYSPAHCQAQHNIM